jgi:bacterioferritin
LKGDAEVIEALNNALALELTAINQYFVQARMCRKWGFHKLAGKQHTESIEEMRHAESLIDRILFLDGTPIAHYETIHGGTDIKDQLEHDLALELRGVKTYNDGIEICLKAKDAGSREELEHILTMSEEHVEWLESQLNLIKVVGLDNYLADQIGEEPGPSEGHD